MSYKTITVEDKLRSLYKLQLIDSRVDNIRNLRGELPLEVQDLEDEIEGLKSRNQKIENEVTEFENIISEKKNGIKEAEMFIKKYTEQQKSVRNNREYSSISKEIEFQELEIQLLEKQIKEFLQKIELKKQDSEQTQKSLKEKEVYLTEKKGELDSILEDTEKEEKNLLEKAKIFRAKIDASLIGVYDRLRSNLNNGLAIAPLERGASVGSFFVIPPQIQQEVAMRKRIITDEHSGRILIDPLLAEEEQENILKMLS